MGRYKGITMATMKDFLLQYYMQRRFNSMPAEVRAKYDDYLKAEDGKGGRGDFRGNMKDWRKKLMHENPAGSGNYENNDLPDPTVDPWKLTDEEWEKLYKAFRNAFRSMNEKRDSFKDNDDATNFLNEYFGDSRTHMFSKAVADRSIEPMLEDLGNVLKSNPDLEYLLSGYLGDMSYSDFVTGVKKKKYNKDSKFQSTLKHVVGYLHYMKQQQASGYGSEEFQLVAPAFASIDLKAIKDGFEDKVAPHQLDNFKRNHRVLLNSVTKKKINDVFKNHDGGEITGKIDEAKSNVNYDDTNSPDYIPPKRDDELTPLQQMRRWADNSYNAVLGKYLSAHGNRVYFSDAARKIVEAIDAAKIKPTDGLDKVLSSEGDIKKAVQYKSPTATTHFEWFIKTMKGLKASMPKAFAGALKNGRQMRAIISELIMVAVRDNKVPEAKTAMEVLSVIKYGYTTSKIMDAMRKEELKIFSDGGLSWNKNQGMQFVTKALDSSIKMAFVGVGYGITMVGNAWRLNGSKFNGKRGRIKQAQTDWATQNAAEKNDAIQRRNQNNAQDMAERNTQQAELNRLNTGRNPINAGNLDAFEADIRLREQRADAKRARLDRQQQQPRYQNAVALVNHVDELNTELENLATALTDLRTQVTDLQNDIATLDAQINDPATYAGMPAPAANALAARLTQEKQAKESELSAKTSEVTNKIAQARNKSNEYNTVTGQTWRTGIATAPGGHGTAYGAAKRTVDDMARKEAQYQNDINKISAKKDKVEKFKDARDTINEINTRIDKRNEEINTWDDKHKDMYKQLMAYWDMLESGRDSHTGKMYKWDLFHQNKHAQKKFDGAKAQIISDFQSGYSYAA